MVNMIGGHYTANGVNKRWPTRGFLTYGGNGLGEEEQHPDSIVVWRDAGIAERPPDLYTNPLGATLEFAAYWYDLLYKPRWDEAAGHFPFLDMHFVITNEACGTDRHEVETHIAFERNICLLAQADGHKCVVGKLANGTPQWDSGLWQELYAPWLVEAWNDYSAIYGRHVYGLQGKTQVEDVKSFEPFPMDDYLTTEGEDTPGDLVDDDGSISKNYPGYPYRLVDELEILRSLNYQGGLLICECGLDGGYGVANQDRFYFQITKFEQALREYQDILIGFAWWECGGTNWGANYTEYLKDVTPYMEQNELPKWEGGTEIIDPVPPVTEPTPVSFPNGCFSEPWKTLENGNQEPGQWGLAWNQAGDMLPNGEKATRTPECVHKEDWQLPPNEQTGGEDALILCGDKTYKMFGDYGKWGAMLTTAIQGLTPGAWYYVGGNFQVHYEEACNELDDILIDFSAGDDKIQLNTVDLQNRQWIYSELMCQAGDDGLILVDVHAYTKYMNRRTLFVDNFTVELVEETPPIEPPITGTTEEKIFQISQEWAFPVNEDAALQKAGLDDGYTPSGVERWLEVDGSLWAMQPFFKMDETDQKRSYFCLVNAWDRVEWTDGTTQNGVEIEVVPLWQRDERWKNQLCGYGPKTIENWGCLLTAYTMWARHFGINSNRLVGDENTYYVNMGGFSGNNLVSMAMSGVYNNVKDEGWLVRESPQMESKTKEWLDKGIPVPARVDFKPDTPQWEQHWVLLVGYTDDDWLMNDPWTGANAVKVSDYYGIVGSDVLECIYYYLDGEPVEPDPPTGETVNVKKYFEPPMGQEFGQLVVMQFTTGATQPQQLQRQPDGSCVMFKGRGQWFDDVMYVDYEHWRVQNGQVQKFIDTSDAGNGGRDAYNLHWAQWIPEVVQVGATYHSTPTVTRFNRTNCQVSSEAQASDYLTITEIIPVWTSPYDESIKYYDVLVIEWRSGSPTSAVQETYKFAAGVGYIEWNNAAVGSTPSESNLGGELTGCYLA